MKTAATLALLVLAACGGRFESVAPPPPLTPPDCPAGTDAISLSYVLDPPPDGSVSMGAVPCPAGETPVTGYCLAEGARTAQDARAGLGWGCAWAGAGNGLVEACCAPVHPSPSPGPAM